MSTPFRVRHGIIVENSNTNASVIASNNQVLTGSSESPIVDLATTWNTTGNPTAFKINVTNTASGANSALMDLQLGGTSRFYIAANGNIGVGNTFPSNKLSVEGNFFANGKITAVNFEQTIGSSGFYTNGISSYANYFNVYAITTTAGIDSLSQIRIRNSALIFTDSSPANPVYLYRDAADIFAQRNGINAQSFRFYGTHTDASNYERINISANSTGHYIIGEEGGTGSARPLYLGANNATMVTVAASGNVGIGTINPSRKLHVVSSSNTLPSLNYNPSILVQDNITTNTVASIGIYSGNNSYSDIIFSDSERPAEGIVRYYNNDDSMVFHTQLLERVRITSTGNVGIGTSTPSEKLVVRGSIGSNIIRFSLQNGDGTELLGLGTGSDAVANVQAYSTLRLKSATVAATFSPIYLNAGNVDVLTVTANGNVGIGNIYPSHKLRVEGTLSVTANAIIDNTISVPTIISNTGTVVVNSNISATKNLTVAGSLSTTDIAATGNVVSTGTIVSNNLVISNTTAASLHRSPNAISALYVYDVSKDSDGGAWTEKCQHTSWYNETLMNRWLGAQPSELAARSVNSTTGTELVNQANINTSAWIPGGTNTVALDGADGIKITYTNTSSGYLTLRSSLNELFSNLVVGTNYILTAEIKVNSGSSVSVQVQNGSGVALSQAETITNTNFEKKTFVFTATNTNSSMFQFYNFGTGEIIWFRNISVKAVTSFNTASGDYYQLTTDGKFYRLWKNLFNYSQEFNSTNYASGYDAGTFVQNAIVAPDGTTTAAKLIPNASATNVWWGKYQKQFITVYNGIPYTISLYAKAGELSTIKLTADLRDSEGLQAGATFTLTGAGTATVTDGTSVSAGITSVGNGWYRIHITAVANLTTLEEPGIIWSGSAANGTDGFYVWGYQMEIGSAPSSYEVKGAAETKSEVFRGNKADFPRLAAIICEGNTASNYSASIYDLTEPGFPMWMRFNYTDPFGFFNDNTSYNYSVSALNGNICFASNITGLRKVDFISEEMESRNWQSTSIIFNGNISQRNTSLSWTASNRQGIIFYSLNSVDMTVLPNAPINPLTGLPIPTIAVASGSGVSVIKHDGSVSTYTQNLFSPIVKIDKNALYVGSSAFINGYAYALNPGSLGSTFSMFTFQTQQNISNVYRIARSGRTDLTSISETSLNIAKYKINELAFSRSLSNRITGTFNTGWMPGDIRRCFLSDSSIGTVSGTELLTNGTFNSDVSGWTAKSGTSGTITWNASGAADITNGTFIQNITVTPGKLYRLSIDVLAVTGTFYAVIYSLPGGNGSNMGSLDLTTVSSGNVLYFVATATTHSVHLGGTATVDNVSVKEVIADRSFKAKHILPFGTLSSAQLANNTSLAGYSGFSTANYIRESYSADLDFGTGEWSCSAWINAPYGNPNANLLANPEDFSTVWIYGNGSSFVSSNSQTAPDSTNTADLVSISTGNPYISTALYGTHTTSCYYKAHPDDVGKQIQLAIFQTNNSWVYQTYVLDGTWQRLSITSTVGIQYFYIADHRGLTGYADKVYVWGYMVNPGPTPGVYTPGKTAVYNFPARIVSRSHSSGPSIDLGIDGYGKITAVAYDGTTTRTVTTGSVHNNSAWTKAEACYTSDGTLSIRINGNEIATTRGTPLLTINNANAVLTIGNNYDLSAQFPGSIALLKLSASTPSYEQSQFMYNQEKHMFRPDVKCVLPDSGAVNDLSYDDATDRWVVISNSNESYWTGLIRNSTTAVPAGSYTKVATTSGVELSARSSTNPGVDVSIPSYGLREELVRRAEAAARLIKELVIYDYIGGFTASTTNGSTAITSVAGLTYPASYIGARISGSGIPSNTTIVAVSGTTIYLSAAATATATGVSISFLDFELPVGMEAKTVMVAGAVKQEGATKDYTRLFDGFIETIRFGVAPGATAWVQIQATKGNV